MYKNYIVILKYDNKENENYFFMNTEEVKIFLESKDINIQESYRYEVFKIKHVDLL